MANSLGELMAHLSQLPKGKDTGKEKKMSEISEVGVSALESESSTELGS